MAKLALTHRGVWDKNYFAVTIDSATYFKLTELGSFVGASGRSHTTIKKRDIAQTVRPNRRNAEKMQ
jgi:hypothetical protein